MKPIAAIKLILPLSLCCSAAFAQEPPAADTQRDRQAILAMQGEYTVDFMFDETVLLAEGYERMEPQRSGGDEVVIVVEDSPTKVVLQHILVHQPTGHVTKHWRQDWTYEAPQRWEFTADLTWQVRDIPADRTQGAWTQCVYEVNDAPRYCGTGRWEHDHGVATWTSDHTWRPLPRRDYTKRDDYNALSVVNRHTIVPGGWTHEQDNTKLVRADDGSVERVIAREVGFNDYIRTDELEFGPAYAYWDATADYWARVRERWDALLWQPPGVRLTTGVDGMELIMPLFEQAARVEQGEQVGDAEIDATFAEWVEPAGATAGAQAAR
ncbi:MAG: DUF6607 family protein [Luteimonas sp.]